jgi:hypothetical protein
MFLDVPGQKNHFSKFLSFSGKRKRFGWKFGPYINGSEAGIDEKCIIFTVF